MRTARAEQVTLKMSNQFGFSSGCVRRAQASDNRASSGSWSQEYRRKSRSAWGGERASSNLHVLDGADDAAVHKDKLMHVH